jgi:hypothetical protein
LISEDKHYTKIRDENKKTILEETRVEKAIKSTQEVIKN